MLELVFGCGSARGQVEVDYDRAGRRALVERVSARLRGERDRLLAFDEVQKALGADGRVRVGGRTIEVSRIVGSVGRWRQFGRSFMPVGSGGEARWKRVDLAFLSGDELPPVDLYEIGGAYFVLDGNHRVSVARFHGVEMVDAEVTRFFSRSPAASGDEPELLRGGPRREA